MAKVNVERDDDGGYRARNDRGDEIVFSDGTGGTGFTPVELLLAAVGGCNIVSVEPLTAKRGHRLVKLSMSVAADKVEPNRLGTVTVTYDVEMPPGDDQARDVFEAVAQRVHQRACTVSRSLSQGTEVDVVV
jgi:putative redox protein